MDNTDEALHLLLLARWLRMFPPSKNASPTIRSFQLDIDMWPVDAIRSTTAILDLVARRGCKLHCCEFTEYLCPGLHSSNTAGFKDLRVLQILIQEGNVPARPQFNLQLPSVSSLPSFLLRRHLHYHLLLTEA
jgi:hypothetical protein